MELDPNLITDLRVMFLNGATPSRLFLEIASRTPDDSRSAFRMEEYYAQAFLVATFVPRFIDISAVDDDLLRDLVGRCPVWRNEVTHLVPLGSAWCDELTVSSDELKMVEAIHPEEHPAYAEVWATLPPKAQFAVRQSMVNAQAYYERAQVLARLAGRLQERVAEQQEVVEVPS